MTGIWYVPKFEKYFAHNRGVYGLLFPDRIIYIGSTIAKFGDRRRAHLHDLEYGFHSNYEVQVRYNLYGKVEFVVIENLDSINRIYTHAKEHAAIKRFEATGWTVLNLIRNPA